MTTTLLRGRLQVRVLPGSPENPMKSTRKARTRLGESTRSRRILHERDRNTRLGAYKARTERSRSVARARREPPAPVSRSERAPAKPLMSRQGASVFGTFVHGLPRISQFGQVQRTRGNCLVRVVAAREPRT